MRCKRKFLGLLALAATGVVALASSAQALTPKFLVGKKAVVAGLNAIVTGQQIGRDVLTVPALNIEFNCEKFTVSEGMLTSGTDGKAKLVFEECTVLELGGALAELPCTVKNGKKIVDAGLMLPAELKNGEPAVLIAKIEALIGLEGPECTLPIDNIVKGELCLKIEGNDTVKPKLVASQVIQSECKERVVLEGAEGVGVKDKMLYGAQEAFTNVSAELFLSGAHAGLTVGVSLQ